ncbi:hypothetical protein BJ508DRAFT_378328 [Ascobolus immersus RN42]|uniref:Uncharacterized protein n=1 Tax=Ascobolus immersus RN42 TaxID=1160509 RepID=A0A3N4I304_ASCIM|nr:hypothetical protein BJ508DRAFT_378328 [Ascobolus immersus RN42]
MPTSSINVNITSTTAADAAQPSVDTPESGRESRIYHPLIDSTYRSPSGVEISPSRIYVGNWSTVYPPESPPSPPPTQQKPLPPLPTKPCRFSIYLNETIIFYDNESTRLNLSLTECNRRRGFITIFLAHVFRALEVAVPLDQALKETWRSALQRLNRNITINLAAFPGPPLRGTVDYERSAEMLNRRGEDALVEEVIEVLKAKDWFDMNHEDIEKLRVLRKEHDGELKRVRYERKGLVDVGPLEPLRKFNPDGGVGKEGQIPADAEAKQEDEENDGNEKNKETNDSDEGKKDSDDKGDEEQNNDREKFYQLGAEIKETGMNFLYGFAIATAGLPVGLSGLLIVRF